MMTWKKKERTKKRNRPDHLSKKWNKKKKSRGRGINCCDMKIIIMRSCGAWKKRSDEKIFSLYYLCTKQLMMKKRERKKKKSKVKYDYLPLRRKIWSSCNPRKNSWDRSRFFHSIRRERWQDLHRCLTSFWLVLLVFFG